MTSFLCVCHVLIQSLPWQGHCFVIVAIPGRVEVPICQVEWITLCQTSWFVNIVTCKPWESSSICSNLFLPERNRRANEPLPSPHSAQRNQPWGVSVVDGPDLFFCLHRVEFAAGSHGPQRSSPRVLPQTCEGAPRAFRPPLKVGSWF